MQICILGSAAGGGLPQWNCGCRNCNRARAGEIPVRTQSSIAVSGDGETWAVINASPDIGRQLLMTPALHPKALRHTPIASVLVTNGDIDHTAGLLTLREKQPFALMATAELHKVLDANPIFEALDRSLVARVPVAVGSSFDILPGVEAEIFSVPGKVPLYLEGETVETDLEGEFTVGIEFRAGGKRTAYIPGCAAMPAKLAERLIGADVVLFDGTLWDDDEMITTGLGQKTGRRMGHMPVSGEGGSLEAFAPLDIPTRVFVHINNSNPIADPGSPEAAEARAAGWTVGEDGMVITP
ncbi:MAG: pyrroloquinoline quinone biosynthesis protein PqqB [Pseudomonadota bacterium]